MRHSRLTSRLLHSSVINWREGAVLSCMDSTCEGTRISPTACCVLQYPQKAFARVLCWILCHLSQMALPYAPCFARLRSPANPLVQRPRTRRRWARCAAQASGAPRGSQGPRRVTCHLPRHTPPQTTWIMLDAACPFQAVLQHQRHSRHSPGPVVSPGSRYCVASAQKSVQHEPNVRLLLRHRGGVREDGNALLWAPTAFPRPLSPTSTSTKAAHPWRYAP